MAIHDNPLDPNLGPEPDDSWLVKWRSLKPIVRKLQEFERIISRISAAVELEGFEVYKTGNDIVQVKTGEVHWKGAWLEPTWVGGGDWETDYTVSGTEILKIRADVSVDGEEISTDAVKIGWDISAPNEGLPAIQYDLSYVDPDIIATETGTDAEIVIPVATVTESSGFATITKQNIKGNFVLPWNRDIAVTILSGGSS